MMTNQRSMSRSRRRPAVGKEADILGEKVPVSLVIFDCDGVLIDSEPIANRVFMEQLSGAGLALGLDEVMRTFVGRTRDGCIALAAQMLGRPLPEGFGPAWDEALHAALRREVRPVEGIPELLDGMT